MRTAKVTAVLAMGMLLSLTIVALPAAAGCSSLVAQPTKCATAIYESAKGNAQAKLVGVQVWGSVAPAYAAACPALPVVGVDLPGLPGSEALQAWHSDVEDAAEEFQASAAVDLFPAAALFIGDAYFSTVSVAIHYSDEADSIVLPLLPQQLPDGPEDLNLPTLPDPSGGVDAVLGFAQENGDSAQDGANDSVACFQGMPLP